MARDVFIITKDNEVLNIEDVMLFGETVCVAPFFRNEDDALRVAFALKERGMEGQEVKRVEGTITSK